MPRERTYRTEAIIIRRSDMGEADRLLTLYTREFGKLKAVGKGARKPRSRKTGHIELFMRSQFMLAQGRNIDIVTQVETIEPYRAMRSDLVRTTYAAYAVELLDNFTPDGEKNASIYQLLSDALHWFGETDNLLLAARYYELRLLSLVGFQPQLFFCIASGDPIEEEDQYFSAEEGGLFKSEYRQRDRRARPISAAAVKVLRFLQTRTWVTVQNLQLRRELHQELEMVMHYYLQFVLEKGLKSADFLHRLRRESNLFSA